jgi:hypothetical protein
VVTVSAVETAGEEILIADGSASSWHTSHPEDLARRVEQQRKVLEYTVGINTYLAASQTRDIGCGCLPCGGLPTPRARS